MPLSRFTQSIITQASGRSIWVCKETPESLERAAKATNTASARQELLATHSNLMLLLSAVDDALAQCERDLRSDEETPAQSIIRALEKATATKPHLRVVRR